MAVYAAGMRRYGALPRACAVGGPIDMAGKTPGGAQIGLQSLTRGPTIDPEDLQSVTQIDAEHGPGKRLLKHLLTDIAVG
jgi:hypothetical protein